MNYDLICRVVIWGAGAFAIFSTINTVRAYLPRFKDISHDVDD